ncbi:MAG TPA: M28 family peptidase [Chthoniobacterales bacterium]
MSRFFFLALSVGLAGGLSAAPISAERIKADVKQLSSDEFEGRGPGEAGDDKATTYLAGVFEKAGLEPGGEDNTFFQKVPLVRLDRLPGATFTLKLAGKDFPLVLGRDASLALKNEGRTTLKDVPLVFAGYGTVDSALGWNAYEGVDMAGKIAIVLANDPDFEAGRDLGFEGKRMAYAGRTGAKIEAALKAGAAGMLFIHEEAAASYPFSQLGSGDALPTMILAPLKPSDFKLSSWITGAVGEKILQQAGLTLAQLKERARRPDFRAFPLKETQLSVDAEVKATPFVSRNVIARLPGAAHPDEYILYGAHWDANGRNGPDKTGDDIRNGAVDNATGTAEVLEIARAFKAGKAPQRTVLFAAWTAEEKGLLGSEFYASHPVYPLAKTVAVINLDPHVVLPAARDVELIGGGRTTLEDDFARAAKAQGLKVTPEPNPEAGWYFRSDHYPFAKRGVPALAFRAGRALVEGGPAAGQKIVSAYNANCYHQPCDQLDPAWTFAGTVQEASVAFALGRELADTHEWPAWNSKSEYKAIRDETAAERTK